MRRFSLFFCIVVLTNSAYSLRCFRCDSDRIDGCIANTKPKNYTCGSHMPYFRQVCAYIVKHDALNDIYNVHSGCELIQESGPFNGTNLQTCKQPNGNFEIKECRICDEDVCNSGFKFNAYWFYYVLALVFSLNIFK